MDAPTKSAAIHVDSGFIIIDDTNTDGFMFLQGTNYNSVVDERPQGSNLFVNLEEIKQTIGESSKQSIRNASALPLTDGETKQINSIDNIIDRIDKNTQ